MSAEKRNICCQDKNIKKKTKNVECTFHNFLDCVFEMKSPFTFNADEVLRSSCTMNTCTSPSLQTILTTDEVLPVVASDLTTPAIASSVDTPEINSHLTPCFCHEKFQKIKQFMGNINTNHQVKQLTQWEVEESKNINMKFKAGNNSGEKSQWEKIKSFHCKPSIFKLKELQILIEEEIKGRNPCSSVNEVKKEICALSMRIVEQVTKDLAAKYQINDQGELQKKLHQLRVKECVKEHLAGDLSKYLSDKAEVQVEDALSIMMFDKPGLLRRGLNCNRVKFGHLKNIIGEIPPLNCKCKSQYCMLKDKCFDMEVDLILMYPSGMMINVILIEVKRINVKLSFNHLKVAFNQLSR